jgi:signal peptidase I
MKMSVSFLQRHPAIKDGLGILMFVASVAVGTLFINSFIFRTFSVVGPSMESTMFTGDRLIVNRLAVTATQIQNKEYIPKRGQVIVFKNPNYNPSNNDEYIVKRVIAFPGEHVTLENGKFTVTNNEHPDGFNPDDANNGEPGQPTSGNVDVTVPDGTLFVSGDHREGNYSFDSRNGLGYVPFYDVIGPVGLRIWPIPNMRTF